MAYYRVTGSFPDSRTISPSVRIVEKDNSFYDLEDSFSIPAMVGFAAKGPVNVAVRINNIEELRRTFGYPDPSIGSYLMYAAEQAIQDVSYMWVVRVADTTIGGPFEAMTAFVDIPGSGAAPFITTGIIDGPPLIIDDTNDKLKIRVNGSIAEYDYQLPHGAYSSLIGDYGFRAILNETLGPDAPIVARDWQNPDTGDWHLRLVGTKLFGPHGLIELVSCLGNCYATLQIGQGMTPPMLNAIRDRWPVGNSDASFNLGSVARPDLHVLAFGTGIRGVDGTLQQIFLRSADGQTIEEIVDQINGDAPYNDLGDTNNPVGFYAENNAGFLRLVGGQYDRASSVFYPNVGRDSKILVRHSSTVDIHLGIPNTAVIGGSPEGQIPVDDAPDETSSLAIIYGSDSGSDVLDGTFRIWAESPGTVGNDTMVRVRVNQDNGKILVQVFNRGQHRETFGDMHKNEFADDPTYYIENVINTTSDWIVVEDNIHTEQTPKEGDYMLTGGSNGIPINPRDQRRLLIGDEFEESGIWALSNPEAINMDILLVPGVSSTEVMRAMIEFCAERRMDCMAIIDPPLGMEVDDIIKWHNGIHFLNLMKLDTSFAALYWPWIQVRDKYNRQDVWLPPSGNVAGVYAQTEFRHDVWWAPAGVINGRIDRALDIEMQPWLTDRDKLYGYDNSVNPIMRRTNGDITIWGQKTLQRARSALDRVNVRRCALYIRKRIMRDAQPLIFRPHTPRLWADFIEMANGILAPMVVREGLYDFAIQCDGELNPPEVIERNELRARIGIVPVKAAEFIFVEITIQRTGSEPDAWVGTFGA